MSQSGELSALAIESDGEILELIIEHFKTNQIDVTGVRTTTEGMTLLNQNRYDIVVVNLSQKPSGVEIYERAKSCGARAVRILTSGGDRILLEEAVRTARTDLVYKPLDMYALVDDLIKEARAKHQS